MTAHFPVLVEVLTQKSGGIKLALCVQMILELLRKCGILELLRQCGILELLRQCGIFRIAQTVWYFCICFSFYLLFIWIINSAKLSFLIAWILKYHFI
jgi:hypothetical protein